jgi:hypothetical protein
MKTGDYTSYDYESSGSNIKFDDTESPETNKVNNENSNSSAILVENSDKATSELSFDYETTQNSNDMDKDYSISDGVSEALEQSTEKASNQEDETSNTTDDHSALTDENLGLHVDETVNQDNSSTDDGENSTQESSVLVDNGNSQVTQEDEESSGASIIFNTDELSTNELASTDYSESSGDTAITFDPTDGKYIILFSTCSSRFNFRFIINKRAAKVLTLHLTFFILF